MFGRKKKERDKKSAENAPSTSNCSSCGKPGEKCCGGKRTAK